MNSMRLINKKLMEEIDKIKAKALIANLGPKDKVILENIKQNNTIFQNIQNI